MKLSTIIEKVLRIIVPAYDLTWNISKYPNLIYKQRFIAEIFYRYIPTTFFFVWIFSLIPVLGSAIYIAFMLLGLYYSVRLKNGVEDALFYFVILNLGFLGIRAFVGHTFMADTVAKSIGWETGSMFQIELAFYHLGIAVAALTYIWRRSRGLLLGIILTKCIFLFGAMGVHLFELLKFNNVSSGNIGIGIIYGDLVLPIILMILFIKSKNKQE